MALISCPECNKEISEFAPSCPICGFPLTPEKVALIKNEPVKHGFHESNDIYEDYDPQIEEDYQKTVNKPKPKGEQKKGRQVRLYFVITIAIIGWLLIIFFSTSKDVPIVQKESIKKESIKIDSIKKESSSLPKGNKKLNIDSIRRESDRMVRVAIGDMPKRSINTDSLRLVYSKYATKSAELGLVYAKYLIDLKNQLILEKQQKEWEKTSVGKIKKEHPEWSNVDCEKIANNEVWIGMSYEMLICERGRPNHTNPSDYGNGKQYQCCWDYGTPSCFYFGEDRIITSYN